MAIFEAEGKAPITDEVNRLYKRQEMLEHEIKILKDSLEKMSKQTNQELGKANQRIDELEEEVAEIRKTLNELVYNIKVIDSNVKKIDSKQDIAIETQNEFIKSQDKMINKLWIAFFVLLAFIFGIESLL